MKRVVESLGRGRALLNIDPRELKAVNDVRELVVEARRSRAEVLAQPNRRTPRDKRDCQLLRE